MLRIWVTGRHTLEDFARNLDREARGGLVRHLRREIHQQAQPLLADLRQAVMSIPTHGAKHRGMRAAVAAATTVSTRTAGVAGVRILVSPGRLPVTWRNMPQNLDDPKGWRHPLFGDRHRWYAQKGRQWFWVTIRRHHPAFKAAVRRAIQETLEGLGR